MAILSEAQFAYTVTLRRGPGAVWRGRAAGDIAESHLVGDAPDVAIAGGVLTLTNPLVRRATGLLRGRTLPASRALIAVGEALETVLHDDDVLRMRRDAMARVDLVLSRGGELVLALGNVTDSLRNYGITVDPDPRADDVRFYYMQSLLDQQDSQLVWLDPASPQYESQLAELRRVPPHVTMVSIAARADDWETSRSSASTRGFRRRRTSSRISAPCRSSGRPISSSDSRSMGGSTRSARGSACGGSRGCSACARSRGASPGGRRRRSALRVAIRRWRPTCCMPPPG